MIKGLETRFSKEEIKTWFANARLVELSPAMARIEVPNKFVAKWLRNNYANEIRREFKEFFHSSPEIQFVLPFNSPRKPAHEEKLSPEVKQAAVHTRLDKNLTFDSFITGETNRFAYASAMKAAQGGVSPYSPLYIFCESSSGKTHLLHAIGNYVRTSRSQEKVHYLTADQFTSQMSQALKKGTISHFREGLEKASILLFDDVHRLAGRIKTQAELTSLFNRFHEADRQIVFAGKLAPNRIPDITDAFKSRLHWGLITEINIPDQDIKLEIIRKKSKKEGILIPDDAAFFLASSAGDIGNLVQTLARIETYSSIHGKPIDISMVKLVLRGGKVVSSPISVRKIQEITALFFNIPLSDLIAGSRKRKYSYPRQLAMYLCRQHTDQSFKEIGKAFQNKDHSTVIYAVRHIAKAVEMDEKIRKDIFGVEELI